MVVGDPPRLTVRYAGTTLDARQVSGKIWFAVDGQAVLTRAQRFQRRLSPQTKPVSTSRAGTEDSRATLVYIHRRGNAGFFHPTVRCLQSDSSISHALHSVLHSSSLVLRYRQQHVGHPAVHVSQCREHTDRRTNRVTGTDNPRQLRSRSRIVVLLPIRDITRRAMSWPRSMSYWKRRRLILVVLGALHLHKEKTLLVLHRLSFSSEQHKPPQTLLQLRHFPQASTYCAFSHLRKQPGVRKQTSGYLGNGRACTNWNMRVSAHYNYLCQEPG